MSNQNLQKVVKNLHQKRADFEHCKGVLGNTSKVNQFAVFWGTNGQDLQIVVARQMIDFCEKNSFSDSEWKAFRAGVSALPVFFSQCYKEVEKRKKSIEEKNNSSV